MEKRLELPGACYVKNVNGRQLVFLPDGTPIPRIVFTRLYDGCKEKDLSYVIVKLFVNIK